VPIQPRHRLASLAAVIGLFVLSSAPVLAGNPPTSFDARDDLAPVIGQQARGAIAGEYIVVLNKGTKAADVRAATKAAQAVGARIEHRYTHALNGFSASLPDAALAALRHNPDVAWIEADQRVRLSDTQQNATWGLDRIDQRNLPLNGTYVYNTTGSGVKAYIIDTGIRLSHSQFGGRAIAGYDAVGGGVNDCNGHGTHVAGTVGGSTYGVAKAVTLVAVRVLNCQGSGTNSQVIAGIDWVTGNHLAGQPAVANMSLGGGASSAIDNAVSNSINDGVTYAIAAGNDNANACNYSPARVAAAITVGATTSSDARASYSNYGTCLDIFAPGSSITSAWYTSDTATNTISGTSMATPHVAGVAALYLQGNPGAGPATVTSAIVNSATTGVVSSPGSGSPNRLLYSLLSSPPPPPPTGCSSLPETYTGSLSGTGDYDYQPNGDYFYTSRSGTHHGCLDGPSGTDFDLYLWKWNGSYWVTVAQGISSSSHEDVTYSGTAGYYVWRIYSYSGSGSYTFTMQRP
jgi:subtilisin family serine protease